MELVVGEGIPRSSPAVARQHALASAFVDIAHATALSPSVPTLLHRLCEHCVRLLGIVAAGVVLTDKHGRFEVAATCNAPPQNLPTGQQ